jgi:hypothetical protein
MLVLFTSVGFHDSVGSGCLLRPSCTRVPLTGWTASDWTLPELPWLAICMHRVSKHGTAFFVDAAAQLQALLLC